MQNRSFHLPLWYALFLRIRLLLFHPDYIQVVSPVDGSPAAKAGIKAGDYITAIDGESYSAASFQEATKKMRGLKGSEVTVTVQRKKGNSFETLKFTLIRNTIPLSH